MSSKGTSRNKGEKNPMFGVKHTIKAKLKMREKRKTNQNYTVERRLKMSLSQLQEKNHKWKGDKVGYGGLHIWTRKYKTPKPVICPKCGSKNHIEISNISGKYKRDLNDWEWLCAKCHKIKDGLLNNRNEKGQFTEANLPILEARNK